MPNNNPESTWNQPFVVIETGGQSAPAQQGIGNDQVGAVQAPQYGANIGVGHVNYQAIYNALTENSWVIPHHTHIYSPNHVSVAPVPGAYPSLTNNLDDLMTAAQLSAATWKRRKKVETMNQVMQLLSPINEVLGVKSQTKVKTDLVVGIEVENEYKTLPPDFARFPDVAYWTMHNEGSLRYHGFEYVSKPLPANIIDAAVVNLCEILKKTKATPTNSLRTSTHVHYDVSRMNFVEILTFASLYWILEGFLSCFAGSHRIGNLFCLRAKDASAMSIALKQVIEHLVLTDCSLLTNDYRYASVNFASLKKFGTLEFRLMRGTLEADEILLWIYAIEQIRQYALQLGTPVKLLEFFMITPAEKIPEIVLTKKIYRDLLSYIDDENIGQLVRESYDAVEDILTAHQDFRFEKEVLAWKEEEQKRAEEREKRQKLTGSFDSTLISPVNLDEDAQQLSTGLPDEQVLLAYEVYEGDDV